MKDPAIQAAFCNSQGITVDDLNKLRAAAGNEAKLLEIHLGGSLIDPELAASAPSVRQSTTAPSTALGTGLQTRWSTYAVVTNFFGPLDSAGQPVAGEGLALSEQRAYRWRMLQSIKEHGDDPVNLAGIRPAGTGVVKARINPELADLYGIVGSGAWHAFAA